MKTCIVVEYWYINILISHVNTYLKLIFSLYISHLIKLYNLLYIHLSPHPPPPTPLKMSKLRFLWVYLLIVEILKKLVLFWIQLFTISILCLHYDLWTTPISVYEKMNMPKCLLELKYWNWDDKTKQILMGCNKEFNFHTLSV